MPLEKNSSVTILSSLPPKREGDDPSNIVKLTRVARRIEHFQFHLRNGESGVDQLVDIILLDVLICPFFDELRD
ncbi:hypothetical protein LguiB_021600 [Lonicera macranthoides]